MEIVGQPVARLDARAKVTGEAIFAQDLSMPGMLHMKLVFAGRPHARILGIDTAQALRQPGVVAVLTFRDVPVNRYGLLVTDQPVLCEDRVRFVGDQVAAVVAETPEQAVRAASLVRVEYQDLPAVSDPLAAMAPDAPLIHENAPRNILHTFRLRRGDARTALAGAEIVISREFRTPMQEHAFLEPEAGLAYIDEEGRITVVTAGQSVHDDQRQIGEALGLPLDRVRVRYVAIGGAFGGREDVSVQIVLALAAWKLRRPVKVAWSREESIKGHGKRHAMILRYTWGARRDGRLVAARMEIISDAGAYASTSTSVLDNFRTGALGPYDVPHVSVDATAVYTNNMPAGAFRGFGAPQATFAAELMVNQLAEKLGIDPVTMRLRNCLRDGSLLAVQTPVPGSVSLPELITACAREAGAVEDGGSWRIPPRQTSLPGHKRRGIGLAIGMKNSGFGYGFPEGSDARIVLHGGAEIERAEVFTAAPDNGQGAHSALAQIAAETLDIPLGRVEMFTSDTAQIGDSGPSSASRLTLFAGNAVQQAAQLALERWRDEDRPAVGACRWNAPPTTIPDPETGACVSAVSFTYGAHFAEVEVDTETGIVTLKRIIAAHDPGCAVNPQQITGQIEGGAVQAQGWSILENFVTAGGKVLTDRLSTYLIPTVADIPGEVRSILIEKPDPVGPFGVRGMGEIPFIVLAPAVVSAVHDATGVWFDSLPLTPERVLSGLRQETI